MRMDNQYPAIRIASVNCHVLKIKDDLIPLAR